MRENLARHAVALFELVHGGLDVLTVAWVYRAHHDERLVSRDPLHGGEIDPRLDKVGYRSVPEGVTVNVLGVQARGPHYTDERITNIDGVPLLGSDRGEEPVATRVEGTRYGP